MDTAREEGRWWRAARCAWPDGGVKHKTLLRTTSLADRVLETAHLVTNPLLDTNQHPIIC
eukprot:13454029-Alexandrium_andersonii.AAC.1